LRNKVFDILEELPEVREVVVSNAAKNRLIAEAQIKTDKIDAKALAQMPHGNFLARCHVPGLTLRVARKGESSQCHIRSRASIYSL
jgi:hypothetical protein